MQLMLHDASILSKYSI